jgi:hypothetical protein
MKKVHPILKKPIAAIETSIAFQEMCKVNEFHNLAGILKFKVYVLMKKPGMTHHILIELIDILKMYQMEDMIKEEFG